MGGANERRQRKPDDDQDDDLAQEIERASHATALTMAPPNRRDCRRRQARMIMGFSSVAVKSLWRAPLIGFTSTPAALAYR